MYVCMYVYKVWGDHGAPSNHILSPASVIQNIVLLSLHWLENWNSDLPLKRRFVNCKWICDWVLFKVFPPLMDDYAVCYGPKACNDVVAIVNEYDMMWISWWIESVIRLLYYGLWPSSLVQNILLGLLLCLRSELCLF